MRQFYVYFDVLSQTYAIEASFTNLLNTYGKGREYYFAAFTRSIDASAFVRTLNHNDTAYSRRMRTE